MGKKPSKCRRGAVTGPVEETNIHKAPGEQYPLTTPLATRLLWRAVMTHTSKFGNAVAYYTVPEVRVWAHARIEVAVQCGCGGSVVPWECGASLSMPHHHISLSACMASQALHTWL